LAELNRRGYVKLPDSKRVNSFERHRDVQAPNLIDVRCELADLGEVEVTPVSSRYNRESKIWNDLMATHHYLGNGPLCGAQIRYLVRSETSGLLGGLSFSAATFRLKKRDEWIGWSDRARRAHLEQIVCNSRFLIAGCVQVPNLASHVLGLSLSRLPKD
jgi:hypothetical protein